MRAKEVARALSEIKAAMLVVPILAMIISAVISYYVLTPVYKTSTTLMVFKQAEVAVPYETKVGTITLNQRLVKTYIELAKSTLIFEEVIKQNNLKMSVEELRNQVTVELLGDTEFLKITVESANPTLSAMLANEIGRVLIEAVAEIMNLDNILVVDAAAPPSKPIWPDPILNILLAGIVGLILVLGVAFFRASLRSDTENLSEGSPDIYQPISPNEAIIYQPKDCEQNNGNDEKTPKPE